MTFRRTADLYASVRAHLLLAQGEMRELVSRAHPAEEEMLQIAMRDLSIALDLLFAAESLESPKEKP